jgi:hypothetical protein
VGSSDSQRLSVRRPAECVNCPRGKVRDLRLREGECLSVLPQWVGWISGWRQHPSKPSGPIFRFSGLGPFVDRGPQQRPCEAIYKMFGKKNPHASALQDTGRGPAGSYGKVGVLFPAGLRCARRRDRASRRRCVILRSRIGSGRIASPQLPGPIVELCSAVPQH